MTPSPAVPVLADDAPARAAIDPFASPADLIAALPLTPGDATDLPAFLRDVAATGLLDVGVDAVLGEHQGYGGRARPVDLGPALERLAALCPAGAAAVRAQRAAIELLARGRRTPANDRLLRALRRGAAVAGVLAPGGEAVWGSRRADGAIVVGAASVRVVNAAPGAAILLPILTDDGRVVTAWVPRERFEAHGPEGALRLVGAVVGPETIVSEALAVRAAA